MKLPISSASPPSTASSRKNRIFALPALLLSIGSATFAQSLPEPPAINRDVTALKYLNPNHQNGKFRRPVHTKPHVPTVKMSMDGRIAFRPLGGATFTLLIPEKLSQHVLRMPPYTGNVADTSTYAGKNSTVMTPEATIAPVGSEPFGEKHMWKYVDGKTWDTNTDSFWNPNSDFPPGSATQRSPGHMTLYDPTTEMPADDPSTPTPNDLRTNPSNEGGLDRYELKVILGVNYSRPTGVTTGTEGIQFWVTPVTIKVSNPKTSTAAITSIIAGTPEAQPFIPAPSASCLELNISADGRLLVLRTGGSAFPWQDNAAPAGHRTGDPGQKYNIVYSYSAASTPTNPGGWDKFYPINHAPYDPAIKTRYGFAFRPFRDAAGVEMPPEEDMGGTYPWIDPEAKNLFFTPLSDALKYGTNSTQSRYPQRKETMSESPNPKPINEQRDADLNYADSSGPTQGMAFMGQWTRGKIVLVDNLNNNIDYALGGNEPGQGLYRRMVRLFDDSNTPYPMPEELALGGGRFNHAFDMSPNENRNSSFIDSIRNVFNYRKHAKPLTFGDVVWQMENAKFTDELNFDDYLDPDAFIIANMSGLISFPTAYASSIERNELLHHTGWSGATFNAANVKFQNAATSLIPEHSEMPTPSHSWNVPGWGQFTGTGGRLEPVASGGFHGRGLWLNGSTGLEFDIPSQPRTVNTRDWYVSLFVDCRFPSESNTSRVLLSFPDGTWIRLKTDRTAIEYCRLVSGVATVVHLVTLPTSVAMLPDPGWAHLAWEIRRGGQEVDFLLNGLVYNRWSYFPANPILFQMVPGKLTVGKRGTTSDPGFLGWIDDFKVFAHRVDPESACNHAGGTLVGLRAAYPSNGLLRVLSNLYPAFTDQEINTRLNNTGETIFNSYANYYDYTRDYGVHLGELPPETVSMRRAIHFPEGPLFYNRPRPDSAANQFCLNCHKTDSGEGLDVMALELDSMNANLDPRRQPSQPFRRVFGNIPVNFTDITNKPTVPLDAKSEGRLIDDWVLDRFLPTQNAVVRTFTLVNGTTGADIMQLTANATVDRSVHGSSFSIRANLDVAQGNVTLAFSGGSPITRTRIPYATPASTFNDGTYTLTATPQTLGSTAAIPVSVTFNVVP